MRIDPGGKQRYEHRAEDARLWQPGVGTLVRLRTWDILERMLPPQGRVLDVGGGPGAHAAWLARRGYRVEMLDPIERHLELARARSAEQPDAPFEVRRGVAAELNVEDGAVDAIVMLGPLYHLVDRAERIAALEEARRALRPGGVLAGEMITRHGWLLDATLKERLDQPEMWETIEHSIATGLSQPDADNLAPGAFWAYFHRPSELAEELAEAGFEQISLHGVEGFGWLLGDLERRLEQPEGMLRALRACESEPSLLGASAHAIGLAHKPR